jgi:kynurenine formamidase
MQHSAVDDSASTKVSRWEPNGHIAGRSVAPRRTWFPIRSGSTRFRIGWSIRLYAELLQPRLLLVVSTQEHGGTHLDAPLHFAAGQQSVDEVPLERLIAPAVVIDVAAQAAADTDYRLSAADVHAWEREHGVIAAGTIVLLRTGWSERWPDRARYLGDDTPGEASRLRFPSYGEDAARLLVEERRVAVLGVDVASTTAAPPTSSCTALPPRGTCPASRT